MIPGRPWVPRLDETRLRWYNDLMTTTPDPVPVLTIRFSAVNQPSGRPDSERVGQVPADQTTVGTMFNYDYASVAPGHEAPVGSVITLSQPSGYVRTWTLEGVDFGG